MEHQISGLTQLVNHYLGGLALALLHLMHVHPNDPKTPITEATVMSVLVLIICTLLALFLRPRLSVEKPGATQQIAEILITNEMGFGIRDLLDENIGHGADRYVPFVGSIGIFILFANLLALFPAWSAPTKVVTVPLGCAVLVFIYFNAHGVRHHGIVGYLGTFAGSPKHFGDWLLAILLFPVEIISTCARILSLTVRLWANMFASDLIYEIFVMLLAGGFAFGWSKSPVVGAIVAIFPAIIPVAFIGLHIFVSFVQAYVFTVLPAVYIGLATSEEH